MGPWLQGCTLDDSIAVKQGRPAFTGYVDTSQMQGMQRLISHTRTYNSQLWTASFSHWFNGFVLQAFPSTGTPYPPLKTKRASSPSKASCTRFLPSISILTCAGSNSPFPRHRIVYTLLLELLFRPCSRPSSVAGSATLALDNVKVAGADSHSCRNKYPFTRLAFKSYKGSLKASQANYLAPIIHAVCKHRLHIFLDHLPKLQPHQLR